MRKREKDCWLQGARTSTNEKTTNNRLNGAKLAKLLGGWCICIFKLDETVNKDLFQSWAKYEWCFFFSFLFGEQWNDLRLFFFLSFCRALADILKQQGPVPISQYEHENIAAIDTSPTENTPVRTSKNHYTPVHNKNNHGRWRHFCVIDKNALCNTLTQMYYGFKLSVSRMLLCEWTTVVVSKGFVLISHEYWIRFGMLECSKNLK